MESIHIDRKLNRGEELELLKTYGRFLKLRKSGFPIDDARHMTGLQDDYQFEMAQAIYQSYI